MSAIFSKRYEKSPPLVVMAAFKRHLQRSLGFSESHIGNWASNCRGLVREVAPFLRNAEKGMLVLHETDGLLMDVEEPPWDLQWRINWN